MPDLKKKKWSNPELIVFIRSESGEAVLQTCKMAAYNVLIASAYAQCAFENDPVWCDPCNEYGGS